MSKTKDEVIISLQIVPNADTPIEQVHYQIIDAMLEESGISISKEQYDEVDEQVLQKSDLVKLFKAKVVELDRPDKKATAYDEIKTTLEGPDQGNVRQLLEELNDGQLISPLAQSFVLDDAATPASESNNDSDSEGEIVMSFLNMMDSAAEILKRGLDADDIEALLTESKLEWADGYTHSQVQRFFEVCRAQVKKDQAAPKTISYHQLIPQAKEILQRKVSLDEINGLLTATGLERSDKYSEWELQRFINTCHRINRGKSAKEVAKANGVNPENPEHRQMIEKLANIQSKGIGDTLLETSAVRQTQMADAIDNLSMHYLAQNLDKLEEGIRQRRNQLLAERGLMMPPTLEKYHNWAQIEAEKVVEQVEDNPQLKAADEFPSNE